MTKWVGWCANQIETCIIDWKTHESETKEEAIIPLAKQLDLLPGEEIRIGIEVEVLPCCDGDDLVDDIRVSMNDAAPHECSDDPSENIPQECWDDLAKRLEAAFDAWMEERNPSTGVYTFEDTTTHVIPDYLDEPEQYAEAVKDGN